MTVLLETPLDDLVPDDAFDVAVGRLTSASGALAGFSVVVDGYAPLLASGRGAARFGKAADGAKSRCDIILDLRGGTPLFPAPEKREGYLRPDPRDPGGGGAGCFHGRRPAGDVRETALYSL